MNRTAIISSISLLAVGVGVAGPAMGSPTMANHPLVASADTYSATNSPKQPIASGPGWSAYATGLNAKVQPAQVQETNIFASKAASARWHQSCGWFNCTIYIHRQTTKQIDSKLSHYSNASVASIAGAAAVACSPLSPTAAAVYAAAGGIYGAKLVDEFNYAAAHNRCVIFDHFTTGVAPYNISTNNGGNCKNG